MNPLRIAVSMALLFAPAAAQAAMFTWTNVAGGSFQLGSNWNNNSPPGPPGAGDIALLNANATYTVTFAAGAGNLGFTHQQGNVTLDIGAGQTYAVTGANGFTVGNTNGQSANLTISSGTLNPTSTNSGNTGGGIGAAAGSTGTLTVNSGATFTTGGLCDIGVSGQGTLTVNGTATLGTNVSFLGTNSGAMGQIIVSGPGSSFSAPSGLIVGRMGGGSLSVNANGTASAAALSAGDEAMGSGTVGVGTGSGSGSSLTLTGGFTIGNGGSGALNVNLGGKLTGSGNCNIAFLANSNGSATVNGTWNHSGGSIFVGGSTGGGGGTGTLTVGANGTLSVTGAGDGITVLNGHGSLTLSGGTINTLNLTIPFTPTLTDGALNITGGVYNDGGSSQVVVVPAGHVVSENLLSGSTFAPANVFLSSGGNNTLTVQGGSTLTTNIGSTIGGGGSGSATVTVSGNSSAWNNSGSPIFVGATFGAAPGPGVGTLNVQNGGTLTTGNQSLLIGTAIAGAIGTVNVTGTGAVINTGAASVFLGNFNGASGTLNVTNAGTVTSGAAFIGRVIGSTGTVTVGGPGGVAAWNITGTFAIGGETSLPGGTGTLTIPTGGVVNAGNLILWPDGTVDLNGGLLTVGNVVPNGGQINFTGGTLRYTAGSQYTQTYNLNFCTLEVVSGATLTLNAAAINGGFLRGAGTFAVSSGATFAGTSTGVSTTLNVLNGAGTFQNFSNSGTFTVFPNVTTPVTFNGFTNEGSGSVTVGASSTVNAADFQTYGTLTLSPGTTANPTQLTNSGTSPLFFNGGSRTFISIPAHANPNQFDAGIDLHGQNAIVAGGLFVNNGYVVDSMGSNVVIADFGSVVKGAGFYQNPVQTVNGGKFQSGNSPGCATFGSFIFGGSGVTNIVWQITDPGPSPMFPSAPGAFCGSSAVEQAVLGWSGIMAVKRITPPTPGNFTWSATAANPLTFILQTLTGATTVGHDVFGPMENFDPNHGYVWELVAWGGTYTGPADSASLDGSTVFDLSQGPFVNPIAPGASFQWHLVDNGPGNGGHLDLLYVVPVPEPSSLALVAVAACGWLARRRFFRVSV
jgi:T5SS/PEP-CTERM-associated repeat protein